MPELQLPSSRSPRHNFPFLLAGQTQKEAFVNEAFLALDALIQPVVLSERNDAPLVAELGDCYLVGEAALDSWSGREGCLVIWAATHWLFAEPEPGASVFDRERGCLVFFGINTSWRTAVSPNLPLTGAVQDSEARAALGEIAEALRVAGIFS